MHTTCRNAYLTDDRSQLKARFSWVFKHKIRLRLSRQNSVAEDFGIVWLQTLEQVPLNELDQGEVYWELIGWAKAVSYSHYVRPRATRESRPCAKRTWMEQRWVRSQARVR